MTAHKKLMLDGFKYKEIKKDDNTFYIYEGDITSFIFAIKPGTWIGFTAQPKEENTFSFCGKETLAIAIQWIQEYEQTTKMRKQLFEIGDVVDYDGLEYVIVDIDNESNTEPIITLTRDGETFDVREHELL